MGIEIDCEVCRALLMYLPVFHGFGAVLLPVVYPLLKNKVFLLQFDVMYLEGLLLILFHNKVHIHVLEIVASLILSSIWFA